jgi:hypothetical protein
LNKILIVVACVCASTAFAQPQVGGYLGPGVLSRGAGDIGDRSGQPVSLRFFADVTGVYDNGIQPFSVDSKGDLVQVNGLYGIQLDFGVYGQKQGKQSVIGLDYTGNFYHYTNDEFYDGTTHNLALGLTYQKSRRISFDFRVLAGTTTLGYGAGAFPVASVPTDIVNSPTSLLFDNRTYYGQGTADVNFILSPRTTITLGGDTFLVRRQASGLAGLDGWNARGTIQHRLSRQQSIGVLYQHMFYNFPPAFGQSDTDMMEGFFSTSLGRQWTFNVHGGAFRTDVQGLTIVQLNPVIAALLGQGFGVQAFNKTDIYPSGSVMLNGRLNKTTSIQVSYTRSVTPGNGVYLTSRQDAGFGSLSYTGIKKWNLGASGGYYKLASIGQGIPAYGQWAGGAGFTYGITRSIHIVGRADFRHQNIQTLGLRETGTRATLGLAFSPGNVPLSLW